MKETDILKVDKNELVDINDVYIDESIRISKKTNGCRTTSLAV